MANTNDLAAAARREVAGRMADAAGVWLDTLDAEQRRRRRPRR